MAKVIPLRSKSLTNLQSLAAPAHPQPYSRVAVLMQDPPGRAAHKERAAHAGVAEPSAEDSASDAAITIPLNPTLPAFPAFRHNPTLP